MKRRATFLSISALCAFFLASCSQIGAPLGSEAADVPLIRHLPNSGSFNYTFSPSPDAAGKSVYFVFTNTSLSSNSGSVSAQAGQTISVNGTSLSAPTAQPFPAEDKSALPFRGRVASFGRNILLAKAAAATSGNPASIAGKPADQDVGGWSDDSSAEVSFSHTPTTAEFCTDLNDDYSYSVKMKVAATCCLVRDVSTASDGAVHRLSIWAADEATSYLTKSMVRALADKFFAAPESSADIYHWDTAVLGQPWGGAASSPFISWDGDKTITILLAPLNSNYDGAVVVGMFWPKDNYSTQAVLGSNQRIMFYVDSKLYGGSLASGETSWGAGNYWPTFVFSTLAHEFQHMIQFYQKQVERGAEASTEAWINEMCSMVMEDLVSDPGKMNNPGPRGLTTSDGSAGTAGISEGRIPIFNYETGLQLDKSSDFQVDDYSTAYAFGAWLARNYGGSELLRRVVQCPQTDASAIVNAANSYSGRNDDFATLLMEWSTSILLSDLSSGLPAGYRYNTGGWVSSSSGGETFRLGSMNFYNYYRYGSTTLLGPAVYTAESPRAQPASSLFYQAATGLKTAKTWSIKLPDNVRMSVVVK